MGFCQRFLEAFTGGETDVEMLNAATRHVFAAVVRRAVAGEAERSPVAQLYGVAGQEFADEDLLQLGERHFGFLGVERGFVGYELRNRLFPD
jgi:hypothetical protein